jgi:hypothetical protein
VLCGTLLYRHRIIADANEIHKLPHLRAVRAQKILNLLKGTADAIHQALILRPAARTSLHTAAMVVSESKATSTPGASLIEHGDHLAASYPGSAHFHILQRINIACIVISIFTLAFGFVDAGFGSLLIPLFNLLAKTHLYIVGAPFSSSLSFPFRRSCCSLSYSS